MNTFSPRFDDFNKSPSKILSFDVYIYVYIYNSIIYKYKLLISKAKFLFLKRAIEQPDATVDPYTPGTRHSKTYFVIHTTK